MSHLSALLSITFVLLFPLQKIRGAENISNAKAAELSLHRIEKLVFLRRIDEAYLSKFRHLSLILLPEESQNRDLSARFKIRAETYPATDGTKKGLDVLMNAQGKVLKYEPFPGGEPDGAPMWPDKDPVTLSENAMHRILDNASVISSLVPFFNSLSGFTISPASDESDSLLAQIDVLSSESSEMLRIFLTPDGKYKKENYLPKNLLPLSAIGGLIGASGR